MIDQLPYREIWVVDFEFYAPPGERPYVACLVAHELRSGRTLKLWRDQLGSRPPFPIDDQTLFVAFYSSAEWGCFRVLGWPMPKRIIDPFVEYRNQTNILRPKGSAPIETNLLAAARAYGMDVMDVVEKEAARAIVMRGPPWTEAEKAYVLEYCTKDVLGLAELFRRMLPKLDLGRALYRGRYMTAAAAMEHNGIPVDVVTYRRICESWEAMKERLINRVDQDFGVFDGLTLKQDRLARYLERHRMPWPRTATGRLDLSEDTFSDMKKLYPAIAPLAELMYSLSKLRLNALTIGSDGRNRTLLSAFRARTSRNQPSNAKSIFGPATWIRSLIAPEREHGLCYLDYKAQEFGIAAAYSDDEAKLDCYRDRSGDPYRRFAEIARARDPQGMREAYKVTALAVMYGQACFSLARRMDVAPIVAQELLDAHARAFPVFWKWIERVIDQVIRTREIHTAFGWSMHLAPDANIRAVMNFPMQGNGAEMLRLAACLAVERGIEVCMPVHDALLVHAPLDRLDHDIAVTKAAMTEASRIVLADQLELRVDTKIVRYPDRYMDKRGANMWATVMELLDQPSNVPLVRYG
jgi:DNA polymerase I